MAYKSAAKSSGIIEYFTPVRNDIQFSVVNGLRPASNDPTISAFTTNTQKLTFGINDYIDLPANETPHGYEEETDIDVHIHIYTNGSDADDRTVKYIVYFTVVNAGDAAVEDDVSVQYTIPGGTADRTHFVFDLGTITGTGISMGADITCRLKRIAADTGTAPTSNPFVSMVGMHCYHDSAGSLSDISK
jgi:hypothetical protein